MRVLIIGGTGLISTGITRQLLARGDSVVHFNRGRREPEPPAGVEQITGDRRQDPGGFERSVRGRGPYDAVIDMICFTPDEARSTLAAAAGKTPHLVFCSTVDVYAKPYVRYPVTEDHPRSGINAYGRGKKVCEDLLLAADGRDGLRVTVLRPAHTYGEGAALLNSFGGGSRFLDRVRRGRPVIVHGDGTSLWASCHRDDVAAAFVASLDNPASRGRAYHLTGEEWFTWNRYTELVAEALGVPTPPLVHIPSGLLARLAPDRAGACADNFKFSNIFDNAAARRDLGFRYTIPFLDGARRVVRWLDERGRIESCEDDALYERVLARWQELTATLTADGPG